MSTNEVIFEVSGMSCGSCVRHVRDALKKLDGVTVVDVKIGLARAVFDPAKVSVEAMIAAIDAAGYEAKVA